MAATILVGLGVGLTVALNTGLKYMEVEYHVPFVILEHVSTALTIGGLWHIIHDLLIKRDLLKLGRGIVDYFVLATTDHKNAIVQEIEIVKGEAKTNKQEM